MIALRVRDVTGKEVVRGEGTDQRFRTACRRSPRDHLVRVDAKAIGVLREEPQCVLAVLKQMLEANGFALAEQPVVNGGDGNPCIGELFDDQVTLGVNRSLCPARVASAVDVNEEGCFFVDLLLWVDEVEFVSQLGGVLLVLNIEFALQAQRRKQRCRIWFLLSSVGSRVAGIRCIPFRSVGRLPKYGVHFCVGENAV